MRPWKRRRCSSQPVAHKPEETCGAQMRAAIDIGEHFMPAPFERLTAAADFAPKKVRAKNADPDNRN